MKIAIIGSRGIPAKYGGFETFAEEISSLLTKNGFEVSVQCDHNEKPVNTLDGIGLYFSHVTKSDNPLRYYFEGIRWGLKNFDILLLTGCGGSIFYFLNIFKKRIIITNPDGLEHTRSKWSFPKRLYLKLSEALAVRFSDYIVSDSKSIKEYLLSTYKRAERKIRVIEYGTYVNEGYNKKILEKYSLLHKSYYLIVCRLEPENNLHLILQAFKKAVRNCPLVIVGNLVENKYVKKLYREYKSEEIRFIGGLYDKEELKSLRFSCKAYIHGHSVGGTNPSLLEAMGSRNLILCHDNAFNREVTDNSQLYFSNSSDCADQILYIEKMTEKEIESYSQNAINRIIEYYDWNRILIKYKNLFDLIKS